MLYVTKILHAVVALLFLWIAKLQLNDPDPLFWCTLYLLAAAPAAMAILHIPAAKQTPLLTLAGGFCVAGLMLTLPGAVEYLKHMSQESLIQDMSPAKPYIEEARECIGTVIALAAILAYGFSNRRNIQKQN